MIITKQVDFLYFIKRGPVIEQDCCTMQGCKRTALLYNNADEEVLTKGSLNIS
jgi:hypothetical protein